MLRCVVLLSVSALVCLDAAVRVGPERIQRATLLPMHYAQLATPYIALMMVIAIFSLALLRWATETRRRFLVCLGLLIATVSLVGTLVETRSSTVYFGKSVGDAHFDFLGIRLMSEWFVLAVRGGVFLGAMVAVCVGSQPSRAETRAGGCQ